MLGIRYFFSVLMTISATLAYGLEVRYVENNAQTLLLSGEIVSGDLNKIVEAISSSNSFPSYFTIESSGGDVLEAMKIGRFIRESASGVRVDAVCASACVFVFVAGVHKTVSPSAAIGLHRPYFKPETYDKLTLAETEAGYAKVRSSTRRYLIDMEVPTVQIEKMFTISSDNIYYLSDSEKEALLTKPSAYSEWVKAKCNVPTAAEWEYFKAKGYNFFDQFDDVPPSDPEFTELIKRHNESTNCERSLVDDIRWKVMERYGDGL